MRLCKELKFIVNFLPIGKAAKMHKFSRGEPPVDIAKTKADYHNKWDNIFLASAEHQAIGDCLYERQSHYCAYCDTRITSKENGFIEHLERRSDNPQRTFDWKNMFFSCKHPESCGYFKDGANTKQCFNPADIVDPSTEEPADFFAYGMNGKISARNKASAHRAEETIRVFNLNNARLIGIRSGVARSVAFFLEHNPSDEQIDEFLHDMVEKDCPSVCCDFLRRKMA